MGLKNSSPVCRLIAIVNSCIFNQKILLNTSKTLKIIELLFLVNQNLAICGRPVYYRKLKKGHLLFGTINLSIFSNLQERGEAVSERSVCSYRRKV